ncbi:hypothetical protein [Pseudoxanthomonas winnipegensis]|nr:hypothetical protein [Pseudoxanthomonas winnipegensis]
MKITQNDVRGRARVWAMAPDDPEGAAVLARRIKHPWYRCQALARVAEFSDGRNRAELLDAAIQTAQEQDEPNRIVTVSAWPLRVLVDRSPTQAESLVRRLIRVAQTEPHNLRRAHALQSLAFAVSRSPLLLGLVVPVMASAILGGHGWRIDRVIRDTFELVRETHPDLLLPLALHHKADRQQQKLLASLPE